MPRTKNFSAKLVVGLSPDEIGLVAQVGHEASTPGARFYREFILENLLFRIKPTARGRNERKRRLEDLGAALDRENDIFLREIADFMAAARRARKDGPVNVGFRLAAAYVHFCQSVQTIPPDLLKALCTIRSFANAVKRRPFTPSPTELFHHFGYLAVDGLKLPSYDTCEDWMKLLGRKPRAKKPKGK